MLYNLHSLSAYLKETVLYITDIQRGDSKNITVKKLQELESGECQF